MQAMPSKTSIYYSMPSINGHKRNYWHHTVLCILFVLLLRQTTLLHSNTMMQESHVAPELCGQECRQEDEEPRSLPKEDEGNAESQQQVARKNNQKRARLMPTNLKYSGKDLPKKRRKRQVKNAEQVPIAIISPSTTTMKNKIAKARARIAMTRIVNNLRNQELASISDTCTPLCFTFYNHSCPSCCCL